MKKIPMTDKQRLVFGWEKRIAFHQKQLSATRKFHREVETKIIKKIKLEKMQLRAIKKS